MSQSDVYAELEWRGLIHQTTDPDLPQKLRDESFVVYCGFDPSADSLHVGNLLGLINLGRFQKAGHKPIALAGGGTGFVGDPSGKSEERSLLTAEQLEKNLAGIREEVERVLDCKGADTVKVVNNADWLCKISYIDFLRDVGKHFTVNHMMEKESVRARLEDRDQGISYTEFSYMLLQAYDFQHLYENHGCRLQVGGSDQFGNITAGCELIRRVNARRSPETGTTEDRSVYGLTWPLLVRSDGKKFGKTEEGAIWLSAERTSPYAFRQYWINVPDADVGMFLRHFTELPKEEIEALEEKAKSEPQRREAQRTLAREVTERVHGVAEREKAEKAANALFGGSLTDIDEATLPEVFKETPSGDLEKARLEGDGAGIVEILAESGLWKSKGETKRAIQGGAANINNNRVKDWGRKIRVDDLLYGKFLVLRKGKKDYFLFKVV